MAKKQKINETEWLYYLVFNELLLETVGLRGKETEFYHFFHHELNYPIGSVKMKDLYYNPIRSKNPQIHEIENYFLKYLREKYVIKADILTWENFVTQLDEPPAELRKFQNGKRNNILEEKFGNKTKWISYKTTQIQKLKNKGETFQKSGYAHTRSENENSEIYSNSLLTTNITVFSSFIYFTEEYWQSLKGKKSNEELLDYYTKLNSSIFLLPYVIAEGFYVPPSEKLEVESDFESNEIYYASIDKLLKVNKGCSKLLHIKADGGTGKSTYLFHIARKHYKEFHIAYLRDINQFLQDLPRFPNDDKPILILLDNLSNHIDTLSALSIELNKNYFHRGFTLLTAERSYFKVVLDNNKDIQFAVSTNFSESNNATLIQQAGFYKSVFELLTEKLVESIEFDEDLLVKLKHTYDVIKKGTIGERVYELLFHLKELKPQTKFTFDWDDWEELCKKTEFSSYKGLYMITAIFNLFGITPPLDFCLMLLNINSSLPTVMASFERYRNSLPITLQKQQHLELRNPNLAKFYLKKHDPDYRLTRSILSATFSKINSPSSIYILRNSYRNKRLLKYYRELIPNEESTFKIINQHIESFPTDPDNNKNQMEQVVIYLNYYHNREAAKDLLKKIIDNNIKTDIHARTKLADLLIEEGDKINAIPIIDFLEFKESQNPYILRLRVDLIKKGQNTAQELEEFILKKPNIDLAGRKYIYSQLASLLRKSSTRKDIYKAEFYCKKLLELNENDFSAMNTLALIYMSDTLENLTEAERLLEESMKLQPYNPHNYAVLAQLYTTLYERESDSIYKIKALQTYKSGIKKCVNNIPLRTQLAQFLYIKCNRMSCAQRVLEYNVKLKGKYSQIEGAFAELAKVYQRKNKYNEAIELLETQKKRTKISSFAIDMILANSYFEVKNYHAAIDLFNGIKSQQSDNFISHIGLAKSYYMIDDIPKFENAISIILSKFKEIDLLNELAQWLRDNEGYRYSIQIHEKLISLTNSDYLIASYIEVILDAIVNDSFYKKNDLELVRLFQKCENIVNSFLSYEPYNERILHRQARLYLSEAKYYRNKPFSSKQYIEKHISSLKHILKRDPNNAYALDFIFQNVFSRKRFRLLYTLLEDFSSTCNDFTTIQVWQNKIKKEIKTASKIPWSVLNETNKLPEFLQGTYKRNQLVVNGKEIPLWNKDFISDDIIRDPKKEIKVYYLPFVSRNAVYATCIEPFYGKLPKDFFELLDYLELEKYNLWF